MWSRSGSNASASCETERGEVIAPGSNTATGTATRSKRRRIGPDGDGRRRPSDVR
jgi:hypothetical protein